MSAQDLPPTGAYAQCGGIGGTFNPICVTGYTCAYSNAYYSQCLACGPGQQIPVCPTLATPSASPTIQSTGMTWVENNIFPFNYSYYIS